MTTADGLTFDECVLLTLLAAFCFGTYGGLRKFFAPSASVLVFTAYYYCGCFGFCFLFWLIIGTPSVESGTSVFKVFLFPLGGAICAFCEIMYMASVVHLQFSTALISLSTSAYLTGVTLDTIISSSDIDIAYLVIGSILAFCGLGLIVAAEYYNTIGAKYDGDADSLYIPSGTFNEDEQQPLISTHDGDRDVRPNQGSSKGKQNTQTLQEFIFWLGISMLSGVFFSMYSVLPAYGAKGDDGLTEPALQGLLTTTGYILMYPIQAILFGHFNALYLLPKDKLYHSVTDWKQEVTQLPQKEQIASVLIGGLVGMGFLGYYYGTSGDIPAAISYAIMISDSLFATFWSVFFFDEYHIYKTVCSFPIVLVVIASAFYGTAIFVLLGDATVV